MHSSFITGCAGVALSAEERSFFRDTRPAGLILFERNCDNPAQLCALVEAFKETLGGDDVLILIDQEGGRVQRMVPPHWTQYPTAQALAEICDADNERGHQALRIVNRAIARDCRAHGINMNCTPVLDLPVEGAHSIIGDRALGHDPDRVAARAKTIADAHLEEGVLPVIKHIPGHGRSTKDSHKALPRVDTSRAELEESDFRPFKALNHMPAAMTAHIVYSAIDDTAPASTSKSVIDQIIRGHIGFDGLLMSDDLSMHALAGAMDERTRDVLDAGCDLALHCNGDLAEMKLVAENARALSGAGLRRYQSALDLIKTGAGKVSEPDQEELALLHQLLHQYA